MMWPFETVAWIDIAIVIFYLPKINTRIESIYYQFVKKIFISPLIWKYTLKIFRPWLSKKLQPVLVMRISTAVTK